MKLPDSTEPNVFKKFIHFLYSPVTELQYFALLYVSLLSFFLSNLYPSVLSLLKDDVDTVFLASIALTTIVVLLICGHFLIQVFQNKLMSPSQNAAIIKIYYLTLASLAIVSLEELFTGFQLITIFDYLHLYFVWYYFIRSSAQFTFMRGTWPERDKILAHLLKSRQYGKVRFLIIGALALCITALVSTSYDNFAVIAIISYGYTQVLIKASEKIQSK